jgi:hypothetical protein
MIDVLRRAPRLISADIRECFATGILLEPETHSALLIRNSSAVRELPEDS